MRKFSPKKVKPNNDTANVQLLKRMRRRIIWQAGLALTVIVLTMVIVFAMTAAWSNNIVQTSGLQFQAQAWGFEGKITIGTDPIAAGPGDEGAVTLQVVNDNQDVSLVSVNVTKSQMDYRMQERLYFYVDAQQTRNGEKMDRVYLNSKSSYTYTLFDGQTLTMNDTYYNDAPLKWHWVYDVLGYYVLGNAHTDETGVYVAEWLKPIEYDYDESTTVFDADGNLVSIDGVSALAFLNALSAKDGYAGVIDEDTPCIGGYYAVDVDAEGYGVYAYLCNYGEIESAILYDTELGERAAAKDETLKPFVADLTVTAEDSRSKIVEASSLAALQDAIASGEADIIRLSGDITIPAGETLTIPADAEVTLDLNAKQITSQTTVSDETAIGLEEGASLTMYNGEMTGSGGRAIRTIGAKLVMRDVHLSGFSQGVRIADSSGKQGLDSDVHLIDCTIDTTGTAIAVIGNGTQSEVKTRVVVEDCTITSDVAAISGNGTSSGSGMWGTDIQIIDSTITGNKDKYSAGIYHPQKDSTLTIYNSIVSGYTGVAIKGGHISVVDSSVVGYGTAQEAQFHDNGWTDTGDAIYIETNYEYDILLEISGTSIIHADDADAYSVQVYEPDASHVTVKIYGGKFDEDQTAWLDSDSEQVLNDSGKYIVAPKTTG